MVAFAPTLVPFAKALRHPSQSKRSMVVQCKITLVIREYPRNFIDSPISLVC